MRKHLWIGFAIAIVCGYYAFRGISFHEILQAFTRANLPLIALAIALYLIDFLFRTYRWSLLVSPVKPTKRFELFWVLLLGFFSNNILPFRMGELVRAHFCAQKLAISRTSAFGTIVMERLFDAASFIAAFLVASAFYPFPAYMKKGAILLGGACLIALGGLYAMRYKRDWFQAIMERLPLAAHWKEKVFHMVQHFMESTIGLLSIRRTLQVGALSLVIWTLEATFLYLMVHSLAVPLAYAGAFFLLFGLGLSVALPQAPGFVGTYEFFGVTALSFLGIPKEQALPAILLVHGLQFILIGILGFLSLWKEGISFKALTHTR